ncbi:flagellar biosynthesis protein FliQ [Limnobacter humi]|uniref:Flagellar biosynthetic protein FliQ n=1 Tax=Limnobacter humi TaxID=1778671 RepID=A0ABT1WJS5_9BURK|nr:flagellar biosynthesis protein FliQ [Limnobacter humi]MCQ8897766.1 flagellar biosynthesis protein FliQ [Limnobacter humi]
MNSQTVLNLGQDALQVMLMVSGPLLIVALILGLLISILQAATQINEMTLSFIPKILGIFATLMLLGPWMLATLVDYTQRLITSIPNIIG